jgi:hypothetical protein
MRATPDVHIYPLCHFFIGKYLSVREDPTNFPADQFPDIFRRYENLFASALETLAVTNEALKRRSEFNFDSGDANNLESGIATLRVVEALRLAKFQSICLIVPKKNSPAADIVCEKNQIRVCCEVKAITKQSGGRDGLFFADQLYEKILENISRARTQLKSTASEMHCEIAIFACVVNWFEQSIYLTQDDYQDVVNRLERDREQESLTGVDGVLFVTKLGQQFWFLNENGKRIHI